MTDMYNRWSRNTLSNYKSALKTLNLFQLEFDLPVLNPNFPARHFLQPCTDASVAFCWAVLYKSILPSKQARESTVGFMSLRLLRSASVSYNTFLRALLAPDQHYKDKNNRLLKSDTVSPQDNIASQLFLAGLAIRVGAESRKGKPLLHRHFV